jgi:hypothetical protein
MQQRAASGVLEYAAEGSISALELNFFYFIIGRRNFDLILIAVILPPLGLEC